jgi:nucleoside-diphosphate-sugar epimerase
MDILILGVNGFIGHHLSRRILDTTAWHVHGMDTCYDRVSEWLDHPRFHFHEGDITINRDWVEYHIKKCDVVLPLVAIATPATYVQDPLSVFELDFEANLPIVRNCVRYNKRLLFPSTSEVYGMSTDAQFHPFLSQLVLGPVHKSRWIYSCAKQLLDRVIIAYGEQQQLNYTLFRPFNWIGPGLDHLYAPKEGSSRVVTQFLGHIVRGEPIRLVDGGSQRRSFTDIRDGINALMAIISDSSSRTHNTIYNIGNPNNDLSIRDLAVLMLEIATEFPEYQRGAAATQLLDITATDYYGNGYQDIRNRVPWIENTCAELNWCPTIDIQSSLRTIFAAYRFDIDQID